MALGENNFSYREIFKRSYGIVKNNKFLWLFGFFAGILGAGGEFEVIFKDYTKLGTSSDNIISLKTWYQGGVVQTILDNVVGFFRTFPWQAFFFLLLLAAITALVIWLAILSQIALFDGANKLSKNKKTGYTQSFQAGNHYFSKVFMINLVVKVSLYALFIVIAIPLVSWFLLNDNIWGGVLFVFFLFGLYIPFSIIIAFIVKYALAFIVIKDQGAKQAFRSGWELFKKNWLVSLEMAAIVLVLGIVTGLIILIALGLSAVPFFLIGLVTLLLGYKSALSILVILVVIMWLIILAIIGGAYVAFQYTAWTLLFLQLTAETAESKLVRWFGKLAAKKIA